jgi:ParB/RepB/Spo0J family partition protein
MKDENVEIENRKRKKFFEDSRKKAVEKDIAVELIEPNTWNPNKMSDDKFSELVKNIEEIDNVQRVLVVEDKGKYRIVDGEHRYKALKVLGQKKIPCTVIELEDEDRQKFISMRMNVIRGKIDPLKFTEMFDELSEKYGEETTKTMMALVEENEFERIYKEVLKDLSPEMRKKLKETKQEIKTVEGLSNALNLLFSQYGTTLKYNYMWFDYGGKKNLMIQCSKMLWNELKKITDVCLENEEDINVIMERLIKLEYLKTREVKEE